MLILCFLISISVCISGWIPHNRVCLTTRIRRLDPPLAGPTSGIRALALLLVKTECFRVFSGFLKFVFFLKNLVISSKIQMFC
ncbi:hypothetical protein HanIR_Chr05g0214581 [Helianthus annuus]|nr:hypothetical protein HanIR_Chr05g0214581 [Helianthus annuus]